MLNAIVVDDELAALKRFERIASADLRLSLTGKFLYAEDALAFARGNPVDLAFLDIEMPDMGGLELAERLAEIDPYIRVVFITAYNQYALDAFRAHAVGYLLKPLDGDEFAEQVDLLCREYKERPTHKMSRLLNVSCFGKFYARDEDGGGAVIRWKTAKAEELFALLVHYHGRARSRESLIDMLWPELEPEKSVNLFHVTCTYLRSALAEKGYTDILIRESDGYRINTDLLNCDLYSWRFSAHALPSLDLKALEDTSALYSGAYLEGKAYDWVAAVSLQLESEFKKIQYRLADEYGACSRWGDAAAAMERILAVDPCDEAAVMSIVEMKLRNGELAAAKETYRKYEKLVAEELGTVPSRRFPSELL